MTAKRPLRRHLPALIWSLAVAALLVTPGDELPDPGLWDWLDKPGHALLFALHVGLLMRSFAGSRSRGGNLAGAVLASGLYAVVLEAAQLWVPGRAWDWWDLVADFAGIGLMVLLLTRRHARLRATS
jgi:VanZ family protein